MDASYIHGKVTFLLSKFVEDNGLPAHFHICDPINKALEALDNNIPIYAYNSSISYIRLVVSPIYDIIKITMFEGIYVIAPIQDKGYRLILSEITHLIKGTNPFLIGIIASFIEKLVYCHLRKL